MSHVVVHIRKIFAHLVYLYSMTVEALEGDAAATREDQLGLKAGRKKRNQKTKKTKKKKASSSKKKTSKTKRGNMKTGPRRRRGVLKRALSHSPVPEDEQVAEDAGPSARGEDDATVHYEEKEGRSRPSKAMPKPAAKGKAKAKAKGAPKARAKAGPAPKAKAKAKAKAGTAPKAKAKAKAKAGTAPKAKAPATKKRGRPSTSRPMDEPTPTTLEGWWERDVAFIMTGYAAEFADNEDVSLPEFKRIMRDVLPGPGDYLSGTLNVYWTRHACGLKVKEANKDLTSFRFINSNVKTNLLQAVSVKAAQLMAI